MKNVLKTTFAVLLTTFVLVRCNTNSSKTNSSKATETKQETPKPKMSDCFEILELQTGLTYNLYPFVEFKIKNKSGKPITDLTSVKYVFIWGDEIICSNSEIIQYSSNAPWDNGLVKTVKLTSTTGFNHPSAVKNKKVRAKVYYDDDSLIWEGEIGDKISPW